MSGHGAKARRRKLRKGLARQTDRKPVARSVAPSFHGPEWQRKAMRKGKA